MLYNKTVQNGSLIDLLLVSKVALNKGHVIWEKFAEQ